ncbi:MAG: hypothetical protein IJC86_03385 [Clostridia bacterium]|nr:hypothetical protein [Clostridia bacterium]
MKKLLTLLMIIITLLAFGAVSVYAETTAPDETYAVESFVEETTAEPDTEAPEEETQQETDPVETESVAETTKSEEEKTENKPADRESLPQVASSEIVIPSAIGENLDDNEPALFWGFVAWICVGVGVAVILAVLLTTKTKAYRAGGKKRYSTGDKISGKQRLLNDKYYDKRK